MAVVCNVVYTMLTVVQKKNFICLKLVMAGERSQNLYHAYDLGSIPRLARGILCNLQKAS